MAHQDMAHQWSLLWTTRGRLASAGAAIQGMDHQATEIGPPGSGPPVSQTLDHQDNSSEWTT